MVLVSSVKCQQQQHLGKYPSSFSGLWNQNLCSAIPPKDADVAIYRTSWLLDSFSLPWGLSPPLLPPSLPPEPCSPRASPTKTCYKAPQ